MTVSTEMKTLSFLENGLTGAALRRRAIADNLANVNTPGYKRKEVAFEEQLQQRIREGQSTFRLRRTDPRHRPSRPVSFNPATRQVHRTRIRNDGNNVDPEREIAKLARTSLYYAGLTRMTGVQFRMVGELLDDLRG